MLNSYVSKKNLILDFIQVDKFICPILHNQINLGNNVFHNLVEYGNEYIEKLSVKEDMARNYLLMVHSSINEKVKLGEEFDISEEGTELHSLKASVEEV